MSLVAVSCPVCGYQKVVSGRGRCRCGVYLIHHWARMRKGAKLFLPEGCIYYWNETDRGWRELRAGEDVG